MSYNLEILSKFLLVLTLIVSLIVISVLIRNRELFSHKKEKWVDYGYFVEPRNNGLNASLKNNMDPLDLGVYLRQEPTDCKDRSLQGRYYLNPNNQLLPSPPNYLVVNSISHY